MNGEDEDQWGTEDPDIMPLPSQEWQDAHGCTGLATYLNRRVPTLTDGKQTPGMEVRFDTTVFAVGQ